VAKAVGPEQASLTWSGRAVDTGRIESELLRLRYEAAGGTRGGETFAIRTSLLNLVVHAADEKAARRASQVIAGMPSHHPSRSIIVVTKPSAAQSRIDAELSAHCHVSPGLEQQVCCEEVVLRVRGRAAEHLHSIIIPLLVSDLPVYMWWTGPLLGLTHVLEEVQGSADRLIADSARFADAASGLGQLVQLSGERPLRGIGDLNWDRLTPWRQLLMQHWQAPNLRPYLEKVDAVEIAFAESGHQAQPSQAFLLLGWLAARFGWNTEKISRAGPGGGFTIDAAKGAVSVRMAPAAGCPDLEPGWLVSVLLRGRGKGERASLSIGRTGDPMHLAVRIEEPERVLEGRVRIEACDEGEMLAQELDMVGRDLQYEHALGRALAILRALAGGR